MNLKVQISQPCCSSFSCATPDVYIWTPMKDWVRSSLIPKGRDRNLKFQNTLSPRLRQACLWGCRMYSSVGTGSSTNSWRRSPGKMIETAHQTRLAKFSTSQVGRNLRFLCSSNSKSGYGNRSHLLIKQGRFEDSPTYADHMLHLYAVSLFPGHDSGYPFTTVFCIQSGESDPNGTCKYDSSCLKAPW